MNVSFKRIFLAFLLSMLIIFNIRSCLPRFQTIDTIQVEITDSGIKPSNVDLSVYLDTGQPDVTLIKDQKMILITGPIDASTATKFKSLLTNDINTVAISSPGGEIISAIDIANEIYQQGIDTFIPSEGGCFSGCTIIFQAGKRRIAYENSMLMYHSAKLKLPNGDNQVSAYGTSIYWAYLMMFDINPSIIYMMENMETDYLITAINSKKYNIATGIIMLDK